MDLSGRFFAADAFLEVLKKAHAIVPHHHDLTVEDRSIGKVIGRCDDLRHLVADEFFTAGPDEGFATPFDKLSADTVPFPLAKPLFDRAQIFGFPFQRVGQEKGVWFADVVARGGLEDEFFIA